ncbi:MAG: carboxypeptidase-like regulatory domain-containing protein [bacterium]
MRLLTASIAARLLVLLTLARAASAQDIRGTVRDSATSAPVPGAVVMVLNAADVVLGRNITNQRGEYRIPSTSGGTRLRVVRLGFRPRMQPLLAPTDGIAPFDVTITAIPITLDSVRTLAAASCPQRSDAPAALALFEQARHGLLTTVVSRGVKPARMKRLFFDRHFDSTSQNITHQRVHADSTVSMSSFGAVRRASEFVQQGFMLDIAGIRTFFAPDAETLLDDEFAGGYCFRIMDAQRSRPHQIGLGFRAADSRRDRVDIDGALWIDTLARALVDVEFRYTGMDRAYEPYHPGGRVSFRAIRNGVVLVDRWTLRLVDPHDDAATAMLKRLQPRRNSDTRCPTRSCYKSAAPAQYDVHEVGGELAHAVWDDGSTFDDALGRLVVHALQDSSKAMVRTVMKLDDTEYQSVSDANGDMTFEDLIPGPYDLFVVDPDLLPLGFTLATGASFSAVRDSTVSLRVPVPAAVDYAAHLCAADKGTMGSAWILGRVATADGHPVDGATWVVQRPVEGGGWEDVGPGGVTGADGTFHDCRLSPNMTVRVVAQHPGAADAFSLRGLTGRLTVVTLEMRPR